MRKEHTKENNLRYNDWRTIEVESNLRPLSLCVLTTVEKCFLSSLLAAIKAVATVYACSSFSNTIEF